MLLCRSVFNTKLIVRNLWLSRLNVRGLRTIVRRFYERDDPGFHRQHQALQVKALRLAIDRAAYANYNQDNIEELVRTHLAQPEFHNASRSSAFVTVIETLLRYRMVQSALNVADMAISEAFIFDPRLSIRLKPMYLLTERMDNQTRVNKIKCVFQSPHYQEEFLSELLDVVEDFSGENLAKAIYQEYENVRGEVSTSVPNLFKYVARWSRNPFVGAWSYRDPQESAGGRTKRRLIWHANVLKAAWTVNDKLATAVSKDILSDLELQNIGPDINLTNKLLAVQLKTRQYERVMDLYKLSTTRVLHRSMFPNGETFQLMFRAIFDRAKLRHIAPHHRNSDRTNHSAYSRFAKARSLFQTMTKYHRIATHDSVSSPSRVVGTAVLHAALQAFLQERDYAAAYVVIRSMHRFSIPVTVRPYRIVLDHVVTLLRTNVETAGPMWAEALFGTYPIPKCCQEPWSISHPNVYALLQTRPDEPSIHSKFDPAVEISTTGMLDIQKLSSQFYSFIEDSDSLSVYHLPTTLESHERAQAHQLARDFGLKSISVNRSDKSGLPVRQLTIQKVRYLQD